MTKDVINRTYFQINQLISKPPMTCYVNRKRRSLPPGIYLFQPNNGNTRTICEFSSKLTIKTPEQRRSGVFIVNFDQISHFLLVLQS